MEIYINCSGTGGSSLALAINCIPSSLQGEIVSWNFDYFMSIVERECKKDSNTRMPSREELLRLLDTKKRPLSANLRTRKALPNDVQRNVNFDNGIQLQGFQIAEKYTLMLKLP